MIQRKNLLERKMKNGFEKKVGKNLFNNTFKSSTSNGVELIMQDEKMIFKGTSTANADFRVSMKIPEECIGEIVTLTIFGFENSNFNNAGFKRISDGSNIAIITAPANSITFLVTQDIYDNANMFHFYLPSGRTVNDEFTIQLELGKVSTDFEAHKITTPISLNNTIENPIRDLKVYGNSEQGVLPAEYQQVEYIESTGTQYIDTGINADYKLSLIFDIQVTDDTKTQNFGAIHTNNGVYLRHHWNYQEVDGRKTLRYFFEEDNQSRTLFYDVSLSRNVYNIDMYNKKLNDIAITRIDFDTTLNYWLFGRNSDREDLKIKSLIKLYSCKMYYENKLVRDFIPCYRVSDNKPGLYDLVNNIFYINQGTGEFVVGKNTPTPSVPIEIESCGDEGNVEVISRGYNLLPVLNESQTKNGVDFTINADGTITANGTATSQIVFPINSVSQGTQVTFYIEKNTYKLDLGVPSSNTTYFLQGLYKKANGETMYPTSMASKIPIEENVLMGVGIIIRAGVELDNVTFKPMLFIWDEKGRPYQQYRETTINFPLTEPLRRVNDIADYIDWKNRQVVRNIEKVVLDGNEKWGLQSKEATSTVMRYHIKKYTNKYLSTHFIHNSQTDNRLVFLNSDKNLYMRINKETTGVANTDANATVLEKMKTWLSNNNVTVICQLETPTYEPFTEEQNAIADLILTPNYCNITSSNEVKPSKIEFSYKSKVK